MLAIDVGLAHRTVCLEPIDTRDMLTSTTVAEPW